MNLEQGKVKQVREQIFPNLLIWFLDITFKLGLVLMRISLELTWIKLFKVIKRNKTRQAVESGLRAWGLLMYLFFYDNL
jgi:hypothetical protein